MMIKNREVKNIYFKYLLDNFHKDFEKYKYDEKHDMIGYSTNDNIYIEIENYRRYYQVAFHHQKDTYDHKVNHIDFYWYDIFKYLIIKFKTNTIIKEYNKINNLKLYESQINFLPLNYKRKIKIKKIL